MEASYEAHVLNRLPQVLGAAPAEDVGRQKAAESVLKAARSITASASVGEKKYGRNDKVTITNGTETQEMKFKKAEPLIASGEWKIVEK
jgi:preprotein translocase subunit SecA